MTLVQPSLAKSPEVDRYRYGECQIFAHALWRLTGYPLVAMVQDVELPEEDRLSDDPEDTYYREHSHVGVRIDENHYADATGIHYFENPSNCPTDWSVPATSTSETYMLNYGIESQSVMHLYSYFADTEPDEVALEEARQRALEWGCVDLINSFKGRDRTATPESPSFP